MENPYSYKKYQWRITARPRISAQAVVGRRKTESGTHEYLVHWSGRHRQPGWLPREVLVQALYDSTFSRTVWRLYGCAKGLVMWY